MDKTQLLLAHESNVFPNFPLSSQYVPVTGEIKIAEDLGIFANTGWCAAFLSASRQVQHHLVHSEQMLSAVMHGFLHKQAHNNIFGLHVPLAAIDLSVKYEDLDKKTKKGKPLQTAHRSGRTRLLVSHSDPAKGFDLLAISDFIRRIEQFLGLDTTALYAVTDRPNAYAVVASNVWMESPALLSLFCLLLRTGEVHNPESSPLDTIAKVSEGTLKTDRQTDRDLWARTQAAFRRMLQVGYRPYFYIDPLKNYVTDHATSVGNDWLAFAEGHGTVKHWSREELKNYPTMRERQERREREKLKDQSEVTIAEELVAAAVNA